MRRCVSCQAEVAEQARFCKACGEPVAQADEAPAPELPLAGSEAGQQPEREPEPESETAPVPEPRRRGRGMLILARTSLVFALVGAGFVAGWLVASDRSLVEASEIPDRQEAAPVDAVEKLMPDLRGLQLADARQILADLGVGQRQVRVEEQPAAGEAGAVLVQDPVYGYEIEGDLVLTVSTPARVPVVDGRDAAEVLNELEQLGASVETVSEYVPGVPAGQAARIEPPPGEPLPDNLVLVVATAPDQLNLADVYAVEDECWADEGTMNGVRFANLLVCETYGDPIRQTYVVNRAADRVSGVLGVPDDADPADVVRVEVIGDGASLGTFDARYGTTTRFSVPVTGVLRLSLRITGSGSDYPTAGLGRLILEGDPEAIDRLRKQQ